MNKQKKLFLALFLLFTILIIIFSLSYFYWKKNFQNRFHPGTEIASINLSGKTVIEAQKLLFNESEKILLSGLSLVYKDKEILIPLTNESFDPDLSYPLLSFDIINTTQDVLIKTKTNNFFHFLFSFLLAKEDKIHPVYYQLEDKRLIKLVEESFSELIVLPTNASFAFSDTDSSVKIIPEKIGKNIDYNRLITELSVSLENLKPLKISLKTISSYPTVQTVDIQDFKTKAEEMVNNYSLGLNYKKINSQIIKKSWIITPDKLINWLTVESSNSPTSLTFDEEKIKNYLIDTISLETNFSPIKPLFEIINDKVESWQKGENGQELDIASSTTKIINSLLQKDLFLDLVLTEIPSEALSSEEIKYNIQEIIGTGHSNFAGSSANRIKNIKIGATSVNGILLAPGEEFSLANVLGDISAETGYLPELVIKGDKTIPEYGGGLCQIATTVFRSALQSGLPITERRNHSYRVSYYEPAGTDATIYIPNPDLKFVNDTPGYILIQSRIEGSDIYFDFWGKNDGREIFVGEPIIYNIVKPEPTKYIETDELKPGEKKCTEKAHNGANAYFDYKVIYQNTDTVMEKRFNSHYVPWREVCLIGKELPTKNSDSDSEFSGE